MKIHLYFFRFILCLLLSLSACQKSNDYNTLNQWHGADQKNTIIAPDFDPLSISNNFQIAWTANIGKGYSSVVIEKNKVYTMGYNKKQDHVFCLDSHNGRIIWQYSYPEEPGQYSGPRSTPAIDNKNIFTISRNGTLHCLHKNSGKLIWKKEKICKPPIYGISCSPLIYQDFLILNIDKGMVLAKSSGNLISGTPGTGGYATSVLFDYQNKTALASFGHNGLFLSFLDGLTPIDHYIWQKSEPNVNAADPLFFDNYFFISASYGKGAVLLKLENNTLSTIWKNDHMKAHFTTPYYKGGYIYGYSGLAESGSKFICLDVKTGKIQWQHDLKEYGSFIAVNNYFVLQTEKGNIYVIEINPNEYREIARNKLPWKYFWSLPAFHNGRFYFRSAYNRLYCVKVN